MVGSPHRGTSGISKMSKHVPRHHSETKIDGGDNSKTSTHNIGARTLHVTQQSHSGETVSKRMIHQDTHIDAASSLPRNFGFTGLQWKLVIAYESDCGLPTDVVTDLLTRKSPIRVRIQASGGRQLPAPPALQLRVQHCAQQGVRYVDRMHEERHERGPPEKQGPSL